MLWMIDGAYGDLYRKAMGYRPLTPHKETRAYTQSLPRFIHSIAKSIRTLVTRRVSIAKQPNGPAVDMTASQAAGPGRAT